MAPTSARRLLYVIVAGCVAMTVAVALMARPSPPRVVFPSRISPGYVILPEPHISAPGQEIVVPPAFASTPRP